MQAKKSYHSDNLNNGKNSEAEFVHDYKEFVRLMDKADGYLRISHGEFGNLITLVGMAVWPSIVNNFEGKILFHGYIFLLIILGGISIMSAMKESVFNFCICEAARFEASMRSNMSSPQKFGYHTTNLLNWVKRSGHGLLLIWFYVITSGAVIVLPTIVLKNDPDSNHIIYCLIAIIVMVIPLAWRFQMYHTSMKMIQSFE